MARLGDWVDTVVESLHLTTRTAYAPRLCLAEAPTNLVMHGIPASAAQPDVFDITLDPLAITEPEPLVSLSLASHA